MKRNVAALVWVILCIALLTVFRIRGPMPTGGMFYCAMLVYMIIGCLAVGRHDRVQRLLRAFPGKKAEARLYGKFTDTALFFMAWGILLLFWLPAYLALFPGTFGYDVPEQMQQFFGSMPLTSHHPVVHTWLVGIFLQMGERFFHSWQAGFAVFSVLQGMAVTGSLACSFVFLKRRGAPLSIIAAGLLGSALHPILQILSFNATKDTLFGAFFLLFMVAFLAFPENVSESGGRKKACVRLILAGVLMCLLRNQGIYIILALAVFSLLFRAGRGLLTGCLGMIFLVSECFFLFFRIVLGIPEGDKREMLCVPMQQAALVWQNRENADISPEQIAAVEELIEQEALYNYMPECADPVKSGFRTPVLMENPGKYLQLYLELGLQNPNLYGSAWQALVLPYIDGSIYRVPETTMEFTFPDANIWRIERHSLLPAYEAYLSGVVSSPVCVFALQPGMAVFLLIILSGAAISGKSSRLFLGILPAVLFFGTLLLSSGALLRYIYPLMLAVPLLLGMLGTAGE